MARASGSGQDPCPAGGGHRGVGAWERHEHIAQAMSPGIQRRAGVAPGSENHYFPNNDRPPAEHQATSKLRHDVHGKKARQYQALWDAGQKFDQEGVPQTPRGPDAAINDRVKLQTQRPQMRYHAKGPGQHLNVGGGNMVTSPAQNRMNTRYNLPDKAAGRDYADFARPEPANLPKDLPKSESTLATLLHGLAAVAELRKALPTRMHSPDEVRDIQRQASEASTHANDSADEDDVRHEPDPARRQALHAHAAQLHADAANALYANRGTMGDGGILGHQRWSQLHHEESQKLDPQFANPKKEARFEPRPMRPGETFRPGAVAAGTQGNLLGKSQRAWHGCPGQRGQCAAPGPCGPGCGRQL